MFDGGGEDIRACSLGEVESCGSTAILRGREGEPAWGPKGLLAGCSSVVIAAVWLRRLQDRYQPYTLQNSS